jgi:tetratricopeptide (TPR) repeat protein
MAKKPSIKSTKKNKSDAGSNIEVGKIEAGNVGGSIVVGNNNIINMAPEQQVFRSLHQLPQPPADFTGREELIAQLLADFEKGKGAPITGQPIYGLTGMGGIGKTALGLMVAHQLKKDYPDAQIFLDLKGTTAPLSAMDVMRHVIFSFEPSVDLRTLDEANMSAMYQSILHEKKVLLFLDNARSAEQIALLRPPETCVLLVTSRWTFGVPGLKNRHVDVMSQENAEKFLLKLCPRIESKANELAKACAWLPLALRIAGSFLSVNEDWKIEKYLARLNDHKQRLATLTESREAAELTTEPDLLATFELSYNGLSEDNRKRWRMLGVFPASFGSIAVEAMWDLEEDETTKTLGLLRRYSLLDYDETSSRYSLHDLLSDYALSQMKDEVEREARLKHASHYKDVLSAADDLYMEGGDKILTGLRLFDLEWENIRTGQAWVAAPGGNDAALSKLCVAYPDAGVYVLSLRQHPRELIQWLEAALSAARELGDRGAEGVHLGNLGNAYVALGDARKAIEFYEQLLAIARELGDRRGEGAALGNLGVAYKNLGDARKAIEFYEQLLAIARELGDRLGEGTALGNLGNAYADLGEARKAIEFHEEYLAIARELGYRRGEGQVLGNLGNAYADLGEAQKAIEFYEQNLAIAREIGDRSGEGHALGNLGIAYHSLGDARKAIQFYEEQLVIACEIGDRSCEGIVLFNIGLALYDLEEKDRAIDLVKQALEIFEAIESPNAEQARNALTQWGAL